jgi:hypothetical protein
MSGCAICIYDLYEESLGQYREAVAQIRDSLTKMSIPQNEWPIGLLSGKTGSDLGKANNASQSAFEALERALAAKSLAGAK